MIALIQRVTRAEVHIDQVCVGAIAAASSRSSASPARTPRRADRLLERLLSYRIFADADGRMNLSLREVRGGLLLVPQFTLAADTHKGTRAGFSTAAAPERRARAVRLPAGAGDGRALRPCRGGGIRRRHAGVAGQ